MGFFTVTMSFSPIIDMSGVANGWYYCKLYLSEGVSFDQPYTNGFIMDGLMAICALLCILWFVWQGLGSFLLYCPYRLWRLMSLRDPRVAQDAVEELRMRRMQSDDSSSESEEIPRQHSSRTNA